MTHQYERGQFLSCFLLSLVLIGDYLCEHLFSVCFMTASPVKAGWCQFSSPLYSLCLTQCWVWSSFPTDTGSENDYIRNRVSVNGISQQWFLIMQSVYHLSSLVSKLVILPFRLLYVVFACCYIYSQNYRKYYSVLWMTEPQMRSIHLKEEIQSDAWGQT